MVQSYICYVANPMLMKGVFDLYPGTNSVTVQPFERYGGLQEKYAPAKPARVSRAVESITLY